MLRNEQEVSMNLLTLGKIKTKIKYQMSKRLIPYNTITYRGRFSCKIIDIVFG